MGRKPVSIIMMGHPVTVTVIMSTGRREQMYQNFRHFLLLPWSLIEDLDILYMSP
jgi:hypothetical protein